MLAEQKATVGNASGGGCLDLGDNDIFAARGEGSDRSQPTRWDRATDLHSNARKRNDRRWLSRQRSVSLKARVGLRGVKSR
jgi:hypothetical protein